MMPFSEDDKREYVSPGSDRSEEARIETEKALRRYSTVTGCIAMMLVFALFVFLSLPLRDLFNQNFPKAGTMWSGEDIVAPINMKSSDMSLIGLGRKYVEDNNDKVFVVNPDVKQRALDD